MSCLEFVTHLYIKPIQQTTQARTITPKTVAAVPPGEPPEAEIEAYYTNQGIAYTFLQYFSGYEIILLPPTYCHTDSSTCHSKTDIIGQGNINAKYSRVVEELTKDHLTVWRGCDCITHGFHRCDTVSI